MITPLCGNGMSMAIHGAKMLSDCIVAYRDDKIAKEEIFPLYRKKWKHEFQLRMQVGRQIQSTFGSKLLSETVVVRAIAAPL